MTAVLSTPHPYPEYKDSGVPWLGEIPTHWRIQPGLSAFREKQQKNIGLIETTVLSLSYGRIIVKPVEKLHGLVPESFETYQIIKSGDIIIRPTDLQNDKTSLRVGIARNNGIITSAYLCLQCTNAIVPDYGYLLLHSYDLMKIFYGMGSGLRQNLGITDLKRMPVIFPPLDEQRAIVRFLDHIDHRVNRFIRAKRKLLALLNEQKQAIIHQAVTRGLDPDVRLKPSGVEWLGDVPEGWEVVQIKQLLSKMEYGLSDSLSNQGDIRVLTMGNIRNGKVYLPEHGSLTSVPPNLFLEKHDLLFNRTNSPELVGKVGIFQGSVDDKVSFASYLVRLRVKQKHSAQFLNYLLNSAAFWHYARSQALLSLHQANLNSTRYGQMLVPVPPKDEQHQIVEFIQTQSFDLIDAIQRAEREIELIREYRTRLIADVVTGKLDVRGVEFAAESGLAAFDDMPESDEADDEYMEVVEEDIDADD